MLLYSISVYAANCYWLFKALWLQMEPWGQGIAMSFWKSGLLMRSFLAFWFLLFPFHSCLQRAEAVLVEAPLLLSFGFFSAPGLLGEVLPRGNSSNTQSWISQSKSVSEWISLHLGTAQDQVPARVRECHFQFWARLVLPHNSPMTQEQLHWHPVNWRLTLQGQSCPDNTRNSHLPPLLLCKLLPVLLVPAGRLNPVGFVDHFLSLFQGTQFPMEGTTVGEGFSSIFFPPQWVCEISAAL